MWNRQKAIEAILYLANRIQEPSVLRILKVLYLADKLHLSRYGRFIVRDYYVAMEFGPVASNTYDLLKEKDVADFRVVDKRDVNPCRDANTMEFSRTDIECLDEAVKNYGWMITDDLIDAAHDEVWKEISGNGMKVKRGSPGPNSLLMPIERIADGLVNAAEVREHLDYLREEGYPLPK